MKYQQGYMVEAAGKVILYADLALMVIVAAAKVKVPDLVYFCPAAIGLVGLTLAVKGREMMIKNIFR